MGDTISRHAAIRWVKAECNPYGNPTLDFEFGKKVIDHLEQMPSAEPEIIRCEYCAHRNQYRFPPKYEVRDYCEVHEKVTTLNNFCSWADRR